MAKKSSGYDKELDVLIHQVGVCKYDEGKLTVQIRSYDGNAPKVIVLQEGKREGGGTWKNRVNGFPLAMLKHEKFMGLFIKASEFVMPEASKETEKQAATG